MSRVAIDPRGLDVMSWCDYTTRAFADIINPLKITDPEQWKEWGRNARRSQARVPDPDEFKDWQTWAERFNQVMSLS